MKFLKIFFLLSFVIALYSCNKVSTNSDERNTLLSAIDSLGKVKPSTENIDSIKTALFKFYENPKVEQDTLLYAKINYNIARFYGMQFNDTADIYIQKALELIEPTQGNLKDKATIYNGMGNACKQKALMHQANYYYNKAANIVLADPKIDLDARAKTIMLLAAAETNSDAYQRELAIKMNRAALAMADELPAGHKNKIRPLEQLAQLFVLYKMPDSVQVYIKKMEKLHSEFPDTYAPDFLYESKASYYFLKKDFQNALKNYLLKEKIDEANYHKDITEQVFINNYFVTLVNTALTYLGMKQTDNAVAYLKKAEKIQSAHHDLISAENKILYYRTQSDIQKNTGNTNEALANLQKAFDVQNDHSHHQNMQAVAEMGSLYQLQAKDNSINHLNKNIQINELELKENRLWLIISALAFLLLLLALGFIYYRNRQQRYNQEREKIILQQQLLRTQMEPHFIFNTLSALQSSIRLNKNEEAINYLSRFSRLLRSSLELSREQIVPLGDEIEALENYLNLQQLRFENAFTYDIQIPEEQDIEMLMLPPMLIQPFVENAIIHGIDLSDTNAVITLNFELDGNLLIVKIADSGNNDSVSNAIPGTSLSGTITRERIRLLGKNASVESHQNDKGGTTVVLKIPVE
ncbi:tetratricopeptide repeat-containing sensor histidine kinase [Elizabethkingia anophelis]|uniref:tetratricopeptide repeat-containing sensor histidine kinase n=1 Tax=Elizabethkingia anophelis TaxID=1117645 RepID=UPI00301CA590